MLNVYKPGTEIELGKENKIKAYITKVCIYGSECRVEYEVVYFNSSGRQTNWVQPFEIFASRKNLKIGFNKE